MVEGLNRRFDREIEEAKKIEQIEELAKVIDYTFVLAEGVGAVRPSSRMIAMDLYDADFRKQSEWISVEDRLPNEKEMVLVFCHRVYDDGGYYDSILVAELTKEGKFVPFNCSPVKKGIVTHWMPLPEAPKMKGGAG